MNESLERLEPEGRAGAASTSAKAARAAPRVSSVGTYIRRRGSAIAPPRAKILVISNHSTVRHVLRLMLSAATAHAVVHDDRPVSRINAMLAAHKPDIVVADVSTNSESLDDLRQLFAGSQVHARLLLIGNSLGDDQAAFGEALVTAAQDFMDLLRALALLTTTADVKDGRVRGVGFDLPPSAPPDTLHVTPRERQIIELVTQGLCNKRIARTLDISVATVRTHRQRLMSKFGLHNTIEIAHFAARISGQGIAAGASVSKN